MWQLGITLALLLIGYFAGTAVERRHFASIREREEKSKNMVTINFDTMLPEWKANNESIHFVSGSVVVSLDYFKRFLASLRAFFGGTVKAYEPLMDRARREAMLRMKEDARKRGCSVIINVRLETSRLASSQRDGDGTAGVEILAFGTGLRMKREEHPLASVDDLEAANTQPLIG